MLLMRACQIKAVSKATWAGGAFTGGTTQAHRHTDERISGGTSTENVP